MDEALRNLTMILWAYCAVNTSKPVEAKMVTINEEVPPVQETVVYGAARTPSGKENVFEIEQPADAPNPLGNPIVEDEGDTVVGSSDNSVSQAVSSSDTEKQPKIIARDAVGEAMGPGQLPLPENGKIENELYQQGSDIIDVQAFPIQDVNEVTTPNTQPAIVTQ